MQKAQHREQIKGQVITSSMREASTQMARSERATPLEIYKTASAERRMLHRALL